MKKFLKLFLLVGILTITLVSYLGFMRNGIITSADGQTHFEFNEYYSKNIFPRPYGWSHNWFGGIAWPHVYPPAVTYVHTVLSKISPLNNLTDFKILTFSLVPLGLGAFYLIVRKRFEMSKDVSFLAMLFYWHISHSLMQSFTLGPGFLGLVVWGLITEYFGSIVMLWWLYFFLGRETSVWNYYLAYLLFGLMIISSVHVTILSVVIIGTSILLNTFLYKDINQAKKDVVGTFFSISITTFWWLPLLTHIKYVPSTSLDLGNNDWIFSLGIIALFLVTKNLNKSLFKKVMPLVVAVITFVIVSFFNLGDKFPQLPFYEYRTVSSTVIVATLLLPLALVKVKKPLAPYCAAVAFSLATFLGAYSVFFNPIFNFSYIGRMVNKSVEIPETVAIDTKDRILTEHVTIDTYPINHKVDAKLGGMGYKIATAVFRDSATSSPFLYAARNGLSKNPEYLALNCVICKTAQFKTFSNRHFQLTDLFNIQYFILTSQNSIENYRQTDEVTLFSESESRTIFKRNTAPFYAEVLNEPPVLLITNHDMHNPKVNDYNWLRINEYWYANSNLNYKFARARSEFIEENKDLDRFNVVLLAGYKYKDLQNATKVLESFVEGGGKLFVVVQDQADPVIARLKEPGSENIVFINKKSNVSKTLDEINTSIEKLVNNTDENTQIRNVEFSHERITGALKTQNSSDGNFIYLKSNYYPLWKDTYGAELYMGSPTNTFLFTNKSIFDLRFSLGKLEHYSVGFSILSFTLFTYLLLIKDHSISLRTPSVTSQKK